MVDPKALVPVPPGSWTAACLSCVSYLSSEIGCRPSSSFVQPCARGEGPPVPEGSRPGDIPAWRWGAAWLFISNSSPFGIGNIPFWWRSLRQQLSAWLSDCSLFWWLYILTRRNSSQWVSECWFMEAPRRLARGEGLQGHRIESKDEIPRISPRTSKRPRSLQGELVRDVNARISSSAFGHLSCYSLSNQLSALHPPLVFLALVRLRVEAKWHQLLFTWYLNSAEPR